MIHKELSKEIKDLINEKFKFELSPGIDFYLPDDAIVFGGVIREGIAEGHLQHTDDLDIIISEASVMEMENRLATIGYKRNVKLEEEVKNPKRNRNFQAQKASNSYDTEKFDLRIFTLNTEGILKRIDMVIPRMTQETGSNSMGLPQRLIANLFHLCSVDMTCSMIGYNKHFGLIMPNEKVLEHMKRKVFKINKESVLYVAERTAERVNKLEKRGWIEI